MAIYETIKKNKELLKAKGLTDYQKSRIKHDNMILSYQLENEKRGKNNEHRNPIKKNRKLN